MKIEKVYTKEKSRETERGELMEWFCDQLNPGRIKAGYSKYSMGRMGKILQGNHTKDLYALQKAMTEKTPESASKYFHWSLKHQEVTNTSSVQ